MNRLIRNALFNSGGWAITVVVNFLATPYLVYKLTPEGYGVFALLTGLAGYYNLTDLGLAWGVTKFVAQHEARGDRPSLYASLNAALIVQLVAGGAASAVLLLFTGPLIRILGISTELAAAAETGIYLMAGGFLLGMIGGTLAAALKGLQRYDLSSRVQVTVEIVKNIGMVLVLAFGHGLVAVVSVAVLVNVPLLVANAVLLRQELPGWSPWSRTSVAQLKQLFGFSGYVFAGHVSGSLFTNYVIRFVISYYLGPAAVTYYVVPLKLVKAVRGMLSSAFITLFPLASELGARGDDRRIERAWFEGSRLSLSLCAPIYFIMVVFAKPIMTAWMGHAFAEATWPYLSLLALLSAFGALSTVPTHIALGLGYARLKAAFSVISVVLYLAILPVFTAHLGVSGAIYAMMLCTSAPSFVFVLYAARIIMRSRKGFVMHVFGFHLAPFALAVALLTSGVIGNLAMDAWVVGAAVATGLAYGGAMLAVGWLPGITPQMVRQAMRP